MTVKRRDYPIDHRITHIKRKSSNRQQVIDAFSTSWREGREFVIKLCENGSIVIRQGGSNIGYYRDAEAFAKDFFPEILE